jgi:hypothetical protein
MGTAAKDLYIWKRMTIPNTTLAGVYQPVEITDLPVRGRIVRLRFTSPPVLMQLLDWYLADTEFGADTAVPDGGAMSIISQEDTALNPRNIDMIGNHMNDATGARIAALGIPFHLTETGPPGSGVGSMFLSFGLAVASQPLDLVLVIEPLVT